MNTNTIVTLIGFIGIGSATTSLINAALNKRQNQSQKQLEFKETRYKALILLVLAMLDFEKSLPGLRLHGRNFNSPTELLDEIKDERNNMILFASDAVIKAVKQFILTPNERTFYDAAIKMRKDLYGLKTKMQSDDLFIG